MLPSGVRLHPLVTHPDHRGTFTEVFRETWLPGVEPVQWNFVRSAPGSLRGVHVHVVHEDVFVLLEGRATIGMRDLRAGSPTVGLATTLDVSADALTVVVVPRGVLHGLLFHEPSILLVGVTGYYQTTDDLECLWSDPDLGIPWPVEPTLVSERDAAAPPFSVLIEKLRPYQPFGNAAEPTAAEPAPPSGPPG